MESAQGHPQRLQSTLLSFDGERDISSEKCCLLIKPHELLLSLYPFFIFYGVNAGL